MKTEKLTIDKLIVIDETGMPVAPTIRQLIDKDIKTLYNRDKSKDKSQYIAECIVIYYMGDPKSPARQQGLSDNECLKMAKEQAGLPDSYVPDALVINLVKRYYKQNITEAGVTIEVLQKSIHNVNLAVSMVNDWLNEKLGQPMNIEDAQQILSMVDTVNKKASELPSIIKKLNEAKETLIQEKEMETSRGGQTVLSSMISD
jgi:hypothetical protein